MTRLSLDILRARALGAMRRYREALHEHLTDNDPDYPLMLALKRKLADLQKPESD